MDKKKIKQGTEIHLGIFHVFGVEIFTVQVVRCNWICWDRGYDILQIHIV